MTGQRNKISGVLLVDKPQGLTSHDVVVKIRRQAGMREVGHTGTLDKSATGLLVLCFGMALRVAQYVEGLDKEYDVNIKLGVATDTDEVSGNVIAEKNYSHLRVDEVRLALEDFKGEILQKPPIYSAIKINGVSSSRLARKGKKMDIPARKIVIKEITDIEINLPYVSFRAKCSKGTYIRSLARDLGEKLGVGGAVESLRRLSVGEFRVENSIKLDGINLDSINERLLSVDKAIGFLQEAKVERENVNDILNGKAVKAELVKLSSQVTNFVRITCEEKLLGIGELRENTLQPRKVLIDNTDMFC